jgi:outer membrane protein, heavy metal efflux system
VRSAPVALQVGLLGALVVAAPAAPAARAQSALPAVPLPAVARVDTEPVVRLPLSEFLAQVGRLNLDYAAQAFSVPIAEAQVSVAHLFPNPTLAWGAGLDVSGQHQATSYDVSLTQTILVGGKRGARTDVARGQLGAAKAQLDDFLRNLRGTAATAYVDATHAEQVYRRKRRTAEDLARLVVLNARRVAAGDAAEIDLVQSRVDAAQFRAELVSAANDVRASRLAMVALLTPRALDTLVAPLAPVEPLAADGAAGPDVPIDPSLLTPAPRSVPLAPPVQSAVNLDSLTRAAVSARPDVIAAERLQDAAEAGVRVARGDRWSDVDVTFGGSYFTRGTNAIDPTPTFSDLAIGLSFPLPFSNFTHGEIDAARYTARQAAKTEQSVEWKAALDVREAWSAYQAGLGEMGLYADSVLRDAERVRRAKLYSYQHGTASLLDVLTAEQTANDVYIASFDAEQQYAHALIALGQATGNWSFVSAGIPASDSTR